MGGTGNQSFDRVASLTGTINYEVPCGLKRRVPKVYLEHGKIVYVEDNM